MKQHQRSGFTLIEMVVVLAIISVLIVMGLDLARNASRGSDRLSTQEKLSVIKTALESYAARNGYLPCPANAALTPAMSGYGTESRNATVGLGCILNSGVVAAEDTIVGAVPFRAIGLPDNYATDAWSDKFTYAVSTMHTGIAAGGMAAWRNLPGSITVRRGARTVGTSYPITTALNGMPGPGAAFVVVSHGPNGQGAYPLYGTTPSVACGTSTILTDVENCDRANSVYYDSDYNDGSQASTFFDDYVVWGTNMQSLNPITSPAGPTDCSAAGVCQSWCAPCTSDIGATSKNYLCSKVITSISPCAATCVWAGGNFPCP